jgi:hypothetical protein
MTFYNDYLIDPFTLIKIEDARYITLIYASSYRGSAAIKYSIELDYLYFKQNLNSSLCIYFNLLPTSLNY